MLHAKATKPANRAGFAKSVREIVLWVVFKSLSAGVSALHNHNCQWLMRIGPR